MRLPPISRDSSPNTNGAIPGAATSHTRGRDLIEAGLQAGVGRHLHDLRHTGSTWSSQTGATLKEVMARIGHSSTRAAMIYQHTTRDRDQAIAAALDALIEDARSKIET